MTYYSVCIFGFREIVELLNRCVTDAPQGQLSSSCFSVLQLELLSGS